MEHLQHWRVLMFALTILIVEVASNPSTPSPTLVQTLPGCNSTCGDVQIPYPFGVGNSSNQPCFLDHSFELTCNNSTLLWGNVEVLGISVLDHQLDVSFFVSKYCPKINYRNDPTLVSPNFGISSEKNKFITIGCDSFGYLNSFYKDETYSTGCLTRCYGNTRNIHNGTCSGIGCCQVDIPPGMRNISIQARTFANSTEDWGNCSSYSFVIKDGSYNFSVSDLRNFPNETVPMVLDWTVGNTSCDVAKSGPNYACKQKNSYCDDKGSDFGYRCRCTDRYEGNPYHPDGCTDIDECMTLKHTCISEEYCHNIDGYYTCFCPKWWQSGDGKKDGGGCHVRTMVITGAVATFVILFVGIGFLCLAYHRRKIIKLKEKIFEQNGGMIFLQKLSRIEDSSQPKIFTEKQLKEATNNFDESLIVGKGGYGTVFKGCLAEDRVVAIKKSKLVDESQNEQFINEVIVLSQINHKSVVKLLGCCLETKVPLLVYEFVKNGTLFDYLHKEGKASHVSWKTYLKIASEAATALSYLHSGTSTPIIHGDVKSANILLDENYNAKVSDFGTSRLVQIDQIEIARGVPGTFGYIDPEAIQTNQLSDKSDVYSFGVVLVEMLTGENPYPSCRPEESKSLVKHFLSCMEEDRLHEVVQDVLLNEENDHEIRDVAILAAECLKLKGDERPSMKEVAMELEGKMPMEKHPWIHTKQNPEETEPLITDAVSSTYEPGNSSSIQCISFDIIALDGGR